MSSRNDSLITKLRCISVDEAGTQKINYLKKQKLSIFIS